tara:strand:- start:769 stop:1338 length:570 start_codon:yes stop_codon:yes gene_type:complete
MMTVLIGKLESAVTMKLTILMGWVALLAGCMSSAILEQWPEQIPQQSYFQRLYREDGGNQERQSEVEYLVWVARFYEGWEMMPIGWRDISDSVLVDLEPVQYRTVDGHLERIGAQISGEWAKDNEVRQIDSRMLSLWAGVMQAEYSAAYRIAAVQVIARDVDDILRGALPMEQITEDRYGELLGVSLEP